MATPKKPRLSDLMPPELARTFGVEHAQGPVLPLGIAALDSQMGGGLPRGALTEITGADPAWWIAIRAAAAADRICALLDHDQSFFPPAAVAQGVNLDRLLVVRESNPRLARWALERLVQDRNIALTMTWLPGLSDTFVRRLQLAAESSGQAVLLLSEKPMQASRWCSLRLAASAEPTTGCTRRIVVSVSKMRGAATPRPVRIEIDDETGAVSLSAVSADGAVDPRMGAGPS